MSKKLHIIILDIAFVMIFFLSLIHFSADSFREADRLTSEQENRSLAQFEQPTYRSLWEGTWFQNFETYSKDQFPTRDNCMRTYYRLLDLLGVNERNGFIRGKDNHILSVKSFGNLQAKRASAKNYGTEQVDTMKILASAAEEWGGKVIYMNIPHKVELFADMYPDHYENDVEIDEIKRASIIEKAKESGIPVVETNDIMREHRDEYIYFTTDHHWTIRGAYYAYQALLACINDIDPQYNLQYPAFEELEITQNPNRMAGSYLRKWGDSGNHEGDIMEYAFPYDMPEYTRYDNGELSQRPLFSVSRNAYSSFMGSDIGNTVVTTNREHLPSILYIGYSYSNPLEAMSVYNFSKMESIDPRHWSGSICEYLKESQPDYIVVRDDIYEGNSGWSCVVQ